MIFLADENVPSRAVSLLEVFDRSNEIRHIRQYFEEGTSDVEWIVAAASWDEKPVILGGDGRILTRPAELAALKSAGLSFVFLAPGWTNLKWEVFAPKLLTVWPRICREVQRVRVPTVFKVPPSSSKIEIVKPLGEYR